MNRNTDAAGERPRLCPGDLWPGDRVLFKVNGQPARRVPLRVIDVETVEDHEGTIYVLERATLRGPQGGTVILDRTATGRIRAKPGKYGPPANVERLWRADR